MASSLSEAIAVLERVAEALRERHIRNPDQLLAAWATRELAALINAFDTEQGRRGIRAGVLANALLKGESIGPGTTAEAEVDERTRMTRDRTRWGWLAIELADWAEGAVVLAARAVEADGEEVTLAAVKLRLGPPLRTDETDPVTAAPAVPSGLRRVA